MQMLHFMFSTFSENILRVLPLDLDFSPENITTTKLGSFF